MQIDDKKAFLDSVHGYIYVSSDYCKKIIDTPIFQRLRRIEQVSFRGLCPSARHDRFIHSLGVYYIGSKLLKDIESNLAHTEICNQINKLFSTDKNKNDGWSFVTKNYGMACLLHDCGHAPFSHIFEEFYVKNKQELIDAILVEVKEIHSNANFSKRKKFNPDLIGIELKAKSAKINFHELCSAWLVLHKKGFRNIICSEGGDPILIARMITGCTHLKKSDFLEEDVDISVKFEETLTDKEQLENCFIALLNGHIIDADRLDYFARDRWATGLNTSRVDLERLLYSITIAQREDEAIGKEYVISVNKRAMSELENITRVKDFLNYNIIRHHKVVYDTMMLTKAVKKLAMLMNNLNPEDLSQDSKESKSLYKFFNYKSFFDPIEFDFTYKGKKCHEILKLTTDDDIVYLLKKYFCLQEDINYAQEWMYRQHLCIPLWKNYAEFMEIFRLDPHSLDVAKLSESAKFVCNTYIDSDEFKERHFELKAKNAEVSKIITNSPCLMDTKADPLYVKVKSVPKRYHEVANVLAPLMDSNVNDQATGCETCSVSHSFCEKNIAIWKFFYLYVPRLYEKGQEVDKETYDEIYGDSFIERIVSNYKESLQVSK